MALYQYRATNAEGQISKGQIEALHELDLEAQLKRVGLLLDAGAADQEAAWVEGVDQVAFQR